jgi:hypothetical protein
LLDNISFFFTSPRKLYFSSLVESHHSHICSSKSKHVKAPLSFGSLASYFQSHPEGTGRKDILLKRLEEEGKEVGADVMLFHSNC